LEWVNKHKNVVEGDDATISCVPIISSSRAPNVIKKKKGGGYLRNCAQSLKRIARLFDKDRHEVLRALRKK